MYITLHALLYYITCFLKGLW